MQRIATLVLSAALAVPMTTLAASKKAADTSPTVVVVMKTSAGDIKIELDRKKAPVTVKNFLRYVDEKFYDGTVFHRVIPTFMIQGGGFEKGMSGIRGDEQAVGLQKKTHEPIKNESDNGLSNERGTIAMARTSAPNSATAQFFINVKDNKPLDRAEAGDGFGYCVFGKVISGMDVVDKIKDVEVFNPGRAFKNVPTKDVVIESVRRE
jgi:cyclophilin family peptidyl-prolyl cis-trans isomerase